MNTDHQKIGLMAISLRQLSYALAAADAGNVTVAARRLNISQPAVSAAIATLEAHYGAMLFTRHPGQGVVPTRFGERLFTEIRMLIRQASDVLALSESSGSLRGEVAIGIYEALAPYYLPAILTRLAQELPDVRVSFFEVELGQATGRLHDGSLDLCISYDVGLDREVVTQTLYTLRPFILAPAAHRLAEAEEVPVTVLHGEALVLLEHAASAQYVMGLLSARDVKPSRVIRVRSFELQRSMVANGWGLALSHTRPLVTTSYDGKPLLALPVTTRFPPQRVLLASSGRHKPSGLLEAVTTAIRKCFTELPHAAFDSATG